MENQANENITGRTPNGDCGSEKQPGDDHLQQKSPSGNYQARKKELLLRVMDVTMIINEQYPELSKYLEEMSETIPDEEDPEMALLDIKMYYESLVAMVDKYKVEHPV